MEKKRRQGKSKKAPEQSLKTRAIGFAKELLFVLGAVLVINSFLMASFEVPTPSMEDTVMVGDRLIVNKFVYGGTTPYTIPFTSIRLPHIRVPGWRDVARGDVIVFDWPGERDQVEKPTQMWYLKRCIGLPGDTVQIHGRSISVNGESVANPPESKFTRPTSHPAHLANPHIFPKGANFNEDYYGPIEVPRRGMILSLDESNFPALEVFISREGHRAELRGGAVWIDGSEADEYVVERDYVFAMGDNRDISLDSRYWGFVPVEDIIGTPIIVYWSWDPAIPFYRIIDKLASLNLGRIGTLVR
jgi:signal peptidase I